MTPLSAEFVAACSRERGVRLRGEEMTRIEVFVDAAFAFAVTMLVISFDEIPGNFDELTRAAKGIPAFVASVAQLAWIWSAHSNWSRRYGLQDNRTVVLSIALLIIVLVYIYPLRVMFQGMFYWMTGGFLPAGFSLSSMQELAWMFVFMGTGFALICVVFVALYGHALGRADALRLDALERHQSRTWMMLWTGAGGIGLLAIILALVVPARWVPWTGFTYALLGAWIPFIEARRARHAPAPG